jgi:hypothetical protein
MSLLKIFFNYGLQSFQAVTRTSKLWLAITSDSNPLFKMGKACRQKDGCSSHWVMFTRARITLYPCFFDLMYISVHYFLFKKRSLLFIKNKYFSFYDSSENYLWLKWWFKTIFENQLGLDF